MDEFERYIEHLQRQTRTPWAEEVLARTLAKLKADGERRAQLAADVGLEGEASEYLRVLLTSEPASPSQFESPIARRIFKPLLDEVLSAAATLGIQLQNEVIFANSTDAHPSSSSIPSSHMHLISRALGRLRFVTTGPNWWRRQQEATTTYSETYQ